MKKLINWINNIRLDIIDAIALQGAVDDELRLHRKNVLGGDAEAGLEISSVSFVPVGFVLSGWTTEVNPVDDTQLHITPGVAICSELLAGSLEWGQVTVAETSPRVLDMSGLGANTYGIWIRFVYQEGELANRARWRPDLTPEREELFSHNTRLLADVEISASVASPGSGWLQIAEVVWDGSLVAGDISDRRTMFFEGQAKGTANPAVEFDIPECSQSTSRTTLGALTLYGWAMRVARRFMDLGGREWWEDPAYGENVRSASNTITVGDDASEAPHVLVETATQNTSILLAFISLLSSDDRSRVEFLSDGSADPTIYDLDVSGAAIQIFGSRFLRVGGNARFTRASGANPLFETTGVGWRGVIEGLEFTDGVAPSGSAPLFEGLIDGDEVTFKDCKFTTSNAGQKIDFRASSAGRYRFVNCVFEGPGTASADGISVTGAAKVSAESCKFDNLSRGIVCTNADAVVDAVGCDFDTCGTGVEGNVVVTGGRFSGCTTDAQITGLADEGADAADKGILAGGPISGASLRTVSNVRFGTDATKNIRLQHYATFGQIWFLSDEVGGETFGDLIARSFQSDDGVFSFEGATPTYDLADRFQRVAGSPNRIALLDGAATDPSSGLVLHAGQIHLGKWGEVNGRMGPYQVPIAWGRIRKTSGDNVNTFDAVIYTRDGQTDASNGAGGYVSMTYLTNNYHKWQIVMNPGGSVGSGVKLTAVVTVHGEPAVASGKATERVVSNSEIDAGTLNVYPTLVDDGGLQIGFASDVSDNFTAGPSFYDISWVVFTDTFTF